MFSISASQMCTQAQIASVAPRVKVPDDVFDLGLTQVCATMSQQLYNVNVAGDFRLSRNGVNVDVIIFDNHREYEATTPAFCCAVVNSTMICGWRGSSTVMDWGMNVAAAPLKSSRWYAVAPEVRAHGGYASFVESEFTVHQEEMIKVIREKHIKQFIFTGHSLVPAPIMAT